MYYLLFSANYKKNSKGGSYNKQCAVMIIFGLFIMLINIKLLYFVIVLYIDKTHYFHILSIIFL